MFKPFFAALRIAFFVLGFFSTAVSAAIEVTLDIDGVDAQASTTSKQVYVERLELSFPNQQVTQSIKLRTKGFYAVARFKYLGNGSLTARWLVDGRIIAQYSMVLTFGKEVVIRSDKNATELPAFEPGYHDVSLQLINTSGIVAQSERSIRYFVTEGVAGFQPDEALSLLYPQDRSVDAENFYFRWKGGKPFFAYRLEVERLSDKGQSVPVFKALSKLDVFAPTQRQRGELLAGHYRWRVTGLFRDKQLNPLQTPWAQFSVADGNTTAGGIFIRNISAVDALPGNQLVSPVLRHINGMGNTRLSQTQSVLGRGSVSAGSPYQLQLELQNSGAADRNDLAVEVFSNNQRLGRFPVTLGSGQNATLEIPLQSQMSNVTLQQSLTIQVVSNGSTLDEAAMNLTITPKLRLDALDFNEISVITGGYPIDGTASCGEGEADRNLAYSRLVSAQIETQPDSTQSLLQQGYFTFDAGQQVRFSAYFKDKGLGAWFDGPNGNCIKTVGKSTIILRNHPLQFVAQPLNALGQPTGDAFSIGQVSFTTGYDGMITSPQWTIPQSGQYKITLNDIGEAADLYATLPGGFPKSIHAAGFTAELIPPLTGNSAITHLSPRQATLTGQATTRWRGDISAKVIPLAFNQIAVTMRNPLHGDLSGGEIHLKHSAQTLVPRLSLFGQTVELLDLTLSLSGATARLDYRLPMGFAKSATAPVSGGSKKKTSSVSALPAASVENHVILDQVAVINGGEFVAQYEFDSSWQDQSLKNGELALRLRGSTLIFDASPRLSYTGYTEQASFTGVGLHNAIVRLHVNRGNGLFSVANSTTAFIYGQAGWLTFSNNNLSGEHIELRPASDIASFFNETPDPVLSLLQPYGFNLTLSGGEFSLQDSVVGGVNFSGVVQLKSGENAPVDMLEPFYFNHLVRSDDGAHDFETEIKPNESLAFSADVYRYQPETLQFLMAKPVRNNRGAVNLHETTPLVTPAAESSLAEWQSQLATILQKKSGLLATDGRLQRGWDVIGKTSVQGQRSVQRKGAFLITNNGLQGQWRERNDSANYDLNGFDTTISDLWLKFEDSALTDSSVTGFLNIPYPVAQRFRFAGEVDQQAELLIPRNGISLPQSGELLLDYWHAKLKIGQLPDTAIAGTSGSITIEPLSSAVGLSLGQQPLIYNREQQRIELSDMQLTLEVDAENLGGNEFVTENGTAAFRIDTHILPDGQLAQTRVHPAAGSPLFFIGQPFEASAIKFLPYFDSDEAASSPPTAQPLVEVEGTVFFKVFGSRKVKVFHTALGAQVPQISTLQQGDYGEGAIRVNAELKFVNNYAMNAQLAAEYAQRAQSQINQAASATQTTAPEVAPKPFKAFVGTADLVIINAVSIRGLAEAGLHDSEILIPPGRWQGDSNAPLKAYERIGLGMGADVLKAAIAGLHGIETATRIGGAVVSAAAGVDGTGEQVIQLGTEAVTFVESVALATAVTVGSGGAGVTEIRNAIGNGLSMTNSGIELLKTICLDRPDCSSDEALLLDISSLLVRVAGSVAQFDQLTPKKLASISLQTLDVGIPLLMGVDLDAAYEMTGVPPLQLPNGVEITFNDKKNAALSVASVLVSASRSLVDNNMNIPFNDFLRISRKTVGAARSLKAVQGVEGGLAALNLQQVGQLMDLSFDLADASIDLAQGFSGNSSGTTNLGSLATQFVDVLCRQSSSLQPLFQRARLTLAGEAIQQPLSLTRAVLAQTSTASLPSTPQQAAAFLQQMLSALANADGSLQGCGQGRVQIPAAARAMLGIAAHSLKPMDGSLIDNTGAQVGWAMRSVKLSIDALDSLAQQIGMNQLPAQVTEIKTVLQQLSNSFIELGDDLNITGTTNSAINVRAALKLAQAIPAAMRDLVATRGSSQAAELLDLHIVLMRELQPLIDQAGAITSSDLSGINLYALPLAMINEVQDLSILTQCQKSGLSNLALALQMARQLEQAQPDIGVILELMDTLYQNIQACDASGISRSPEMVRIMQILQLIGLISANPTQVQHLVHTTLPTLLPILVDSGTQMLDSLNAFTTALPITDFTQDETTAVLDAVLNRLLKTSLDNTPHTAGKRAIRKALSIINNADLNMTGLTITRDESGQVVEVKELRADGSMRQFNFVVAAAKQFYPEDHVAYRGGLDEFLTGVDSPALADFDALPAADRNSLFTPFWDELINRGDVFERKYKDADKNRITIQQLDSGVVLVKIIDAVSYAGFTPSRLYSISAVPQREASAQTLDAMLDSIYQAAVYRSYSAENPECFFSSGCAFTSTSGSAMFTIKSVSNPTEYAVFSDSDASRQSFQNFRPAGALVQFEGYINSTQPGWNPSWHVSFQNTGDVLLRQGQSQEIINVGEQFDISLAAEIPPLVMAADQFLLRRVVNGNDIWEFLPGQHALHSYGDGEWEVYRMQTDLMPGVAVPAPHTVIDIASLELMARGNKNGIIDDPAGLGTSTSANATVLTLPSNNSAEAVSIQLTGENAGTISVGNTDLAVVAASTVAVDQIISTEPQADGSQLITTNTGSSQRIQGGDADNLKITITTSLPAQANAAEQGAGHYRRTVVIQYCEDKNQSWNTCPQAKRSESRFEYDWITDYTAGQMGYIDIDPAQRPVITPVSGVNQAIKHQFWRDIFQLEQQVLRNPDESGLQQLDTLIARARTAGLSDRELQQQQNYIAARLIHRLMIQYFNEADQYTTDLLKQKYWKNNPTASPLDKIAALIPRLRASGFVPNANFREKFRELLTLRYRLYLHDLQDFSIGQSNLAISSELANKIGAIIDIIGEMEKVKAAGETPPYDLDFACSMIGQVKQHINDHIINDPNYVVLESDLKLVVDIEGNSQILGCGTDSTLMAALAILADRAANTSGDYGSLLQAARLRTLASTILRQSPDRDDFNQDGALNSGDVIYYYLRYIMQQETGDINALTPPASAQYADWLVHIQTVDRLIREISGERDRRGGNAYFYPEQVIALKQHLVDLLRQAWYSEYQNLYNQFVVTSLTTSRNDFLALSQHYESRQMLSSRLQGIVDTTLIETDPAHYLKVKINGSWIDPLQDVDNLQNQWLDAIWLKSPALVSDWQLLIDRLNEQDLVLQDLQSALPADQAGAVKRLSLRVQDKINQTMDSVSSSLADYQGDIAGIDALLNPLVQMTDFIQVFQQLDSHNLMQQQVQALLDEAVARIQADYSRSTLEINKIIAITRVWEGDESINGLASNQAIKGAIHAAGSAALAAVNNGGGEDEMRAFIAVMQMEQQLGYDPAEWSASDLFNRLGQMIAEADARLRASNDMAQVKPYLDLLALAQSLGYAEASVYDFSAVVAVVSANRDALTGCISAQNCTIEDVRKYLELTANMEVLGGDAADYNNVIDQMMSSSPTTMARSIRFGNELPDLQTVVLNDKTGNSGRRSAANTLERLGNGLSVAVEAGRAALKRIINRLNALASLKLPASHVKPPAAQDPLLQSAHNLQQRIDNWLAQLRQQLEQQQDTQGGVLLVGNPADVAHSLGISEQELNDVALPEINGEINNGPRIVPANKYRLAADELQPLAGAQDASLRLSLRLLQNLPDPQISAEADYRMATIVQLSAFMLESTGQAIPLQLNADTLKQSLLGAAVFTLLSLPAEQRPAGSLLEFAQQQLFPALTGGNATDCSDLVKCLLSGGLQLTANVLDSSLLAVQQNARRLSNTDRQTLALNVLQDMAQNISLMAQNEPDNPLIFWTGIGAEAMNLSLQLANNGATAKNLLLGSLELSSQMLKSPDVVQLVEQMAQTLPQAVMAYGFVTGSSDMLIKQLQNNGDRHLPIAIARMAQRQVFNTMDKMKLDKRLVDAGRLLGDWQLDFADQDASWSLMTTLNSDPSAWISALMAEGGITELNARFNDSTLLQNIRIPAALALTPFIATQSLLNNAANLQDPNQAHRVLADLAADLSNSWFLPFDYRAGFQVSVDDAQRLSNDQPLALILRQIKTLERNDSARLRAVKLVGNLGIGGLQAILPGTALSQVMQLAWNGGANGQGAGIDSIIKLGLQGSVSPVELLELVQGIPLTAGEMLSTIASSSEADATAKLLRIVSATTRSGDIPLGDFLPPDRALNNGLFNSILVSLGEVRRVILPMISPSRHNKDTEIGYLRTVPFIRMVDNKPVLSANSEFATDLRDMINLAAAYNVTSSIEATREVVRDVMLAGVDISRLGINALAPLLDTTRRSEVADLQQRSIFSDLVDGGDSAGFTGVSGGLQTEWSPNNPADRSSSEVTLEMYGQLAFEPFIGKNAGLMQLIGDSTGGRSLLFEAASDSGFAGDMIGGINGGLKAQFLKSNERLMMAYWGRADLEILSNEIVGVEAAGLIDGFPRPTAETDARQYAKKLLSEVDIAQCSALTTQVVPFPLSLFGVGGTATVGSLAEKHDLSLGNAMRLGLSASLRFPGANSLIGLTLGGNITTKYSGELDANSLGATLTGRSCVAPKLTLTLLGQDIPLSGTDIKSQTAVSANASSGFVTTDLKFRILLNSEAIDALLVGNTCSDPSNIAAQAMCTALNVMSKGSLWVVIHGAAQSGLAIESKLIFGLGKFPQAGQNSEFPFFKASINTANGLLESIPGIFTRAGDWGGWDNSQQNFSNLCSENLCELNQFSAAPGAGQ